MPSVLRRASGPGSPPAWPRSWRAAHLGHLRQNATVSVGSGPGQGPLPHPHDLERTGPASSVVLPSTCLASVDRVGPGRGEDTGRARRPPRRAARRGRSACVSAEAAGPRPRGGSGLPRLPLDATHHAAGGVRTVRTTAGFSSRRSASTSVPARVGRVLPRLDERLLRLLPRLLPAPDVVCQVVGEDRAEGRVGCGEEGGALRRLAVLPERLAARRTTRPCGSGRARPPTPASSSWSPAAASSRRGRRSHVRRSRPPGRSRDAGWRGHGRRWWARRRPASPSGGRRRR